jgi:S1-C subfamily serine protease
LLGIEVSDVDAQIATNSRLPANTGALVERVFPGSAAERAGIQAGDVILQVNDAEISAASDVKSLIGSVRAGTLLKIVYLRSGQTFTAQARIGQQGAATNGSGVANQRPFWESN